MIKGEVVRGKKTRFEGSYGAMRDRLRKALIRLSIELQAYIKSSKLSGQVLKNRTGTLRRSINRKIVETPHSLQAFVGTNVKYARPHEYGFEGTVNVKDHLRLVKQAWGRELRTPVWANVKAHQREVKLPERSFLRSALLDKRSKILTELNVAINKPV